MHTWRMGKAVSGPCENAPVTASVLNGLDPEQSLVAETLHGPVLVIAGAGTGKTRAVTHRIAHAVATGSHDPRRGLAVTFTNRAAGEMASRLLDLGVQGLAVRTFHSAALAQLRHFWPTTIGGPFPELVASKIRLVGQACREEGLAANRAIERDVASEIEWAGARMITSQEYPETARALGRGAIGSGDRGIGPTDVARVMSAYQELKRAGNIIDFEDVLLCLLGMLGEHPAVADAVRARYRWFTVDEYQDITPVQESLLRCWLGDRDDICVVGDTNQTIYSFAGADPDALGRFQQAWPEASIVTLARCYRCTPEVVAVANTLSASMGGGVSVRLISQRPTGQAVEVIACADDDDEARTVTSRIASLVAGGVAPRDIAILIRTNAASQPFETALSGAGIPYLMRGTERFFERPEVREALTRLRGQSAAAASEPDGPSAAAPPDVGSQARAVLTSMGWLPIGPTGPGAARDRWESLSAVVGLADALAASGVGSLAGLVAELDRRANLSHAPAADGITICTLHSAKGLEWPTVFVVGCAEGTIPIVHAQRPEEVAEERRLLYVGMTRAQDRLTLSWARSRGAGRLRDPSRFLAELRVPSGSSQAGEAAGARIRTRSSTARRERRRTGPGRCRLCRAALITPAEVTLGRCRDCPSSVDESLVERLREWRLGRSREQEVPAFVVMTDVTLLAVAERRPADVTALLEIPGIGPAKAERYGAALLELLGSSGS